MRRHDRPFVCEIISQLFTGNIVCRTTIEHLLDEHPAGTAAAAGTTGGRDIVDRPRALLGDELLDRLLSNAKTRADKRLFAAEFLDLPCPVTTKSGVQGLDADMGTLSAVRRQFAELGLDRLR